MRMVWAPSKMKVCNRRNNLHKNWAIWNTSPSMKRRWTTSPWTRASMTKFWACLKTHLVAKSQVYNLIRKTSSHWRMTHSQKSNVTHIQTTILETLFLISSWRSFNSQRLSQVNLDCSIKKTSTSRWSAISSLDLERARGLSSLLLTSLIISKFSEFMEIPFWPPITPWAQNQTKALWIEKSARRRSKLSSTREGSTKTHSWRMTLRLNWSHKSPRIVLIPRSKLGTKIIAPYLLKKILTRKLSEQMKIVILNHLWSMKEAYPTTSHPLYPILATRISIIIKTTWHSSRRVAKAFWGIRNLT